MQKKIVFWQLSFAQKVVQLCEHNHNIMRELLLMLDKDLQMHKEID